MARPTDRQTDRTLFQWSLVVVKSAVGVDTGSSYESFSPLTMSRTLWILVFWGLISHTIQLYVTLLSWGTLCFCMKKHVYVPLISYIPWKSCPISFSIALVHSYFSISFIRYLYSWGFPVSGHITAFILTGCIVISPVVLLVCAQSSPVLCTEYVGTMIWGGLCG